MADYLGGKFNPQSGYENDVCVYLLAMLPDGPEPEYSYHDVMDCGLGKLERVKRRSKGGVIAISKTQYAALRELMPRRDIYFIRQHHCNFLREKREKRPVKVVGCIGGDSAFQWPHHAMERWFNKKGFEWKFEHNYWKRKNVVNFFKTIDIQVRYRPMNPRHIQAHMNPLALSNAGSFGIPTVAFPEPAYVAEWQNECLWGDGIYGILEQVVRLREEPALYEEMSERALEKAEEYHIDKVAELYRQLPGADR